jgi:hypothetical protein
MSAILILLATEAGPRPQDGSSRQTGKYGRNRNIPQRMLWKNAIDAIWGLMRNGPNFGNAQIDGFRPMSAPRHTART